MKSQRSLKFLIFILLALLSACRGNSGKLDAAHLEETAIAHLTSVAYLNKTAKVVAQQTDSVLPTLPPTLTIAPTETKKPRTLIPTTPGPSPTITETPTRTSTPTATPLAQAVVTGDTNCRSGPTKSYDWITLVPAGTKVNIIASDKTGQYYIIENPFDEGVCWIWNYHMELYGWSADLPQYSNPPTQRPSRTPRDTPEPRFRIYENGLIQCNGQDALVIRIRNYTSDGFRSWRAQVFNLPLRVHQTTVSANQFSHNPAECEMTLGTLKYYQTGYAIIPIDPYQADGYLIEFEACIDNNKLGGCAFDGLYIDKDDIIPTPTPTP